MVARCVRAEAIADSGKEAAKTAADKSKELARYAADNTKEMAEKHTDEKKALEVPCIHCWCLWHDWLRSMVLLLLAL